MKWKRIVGWSLAGLVGLLLVAAGGGFLYLKSNSFRQFALHKIAAEADRVTGGHTQIGGLDFSLSTLTAHLYNITVHGTEAPGQPVLLHADKLTVGLKILSALHRHVVLSELIIDRPIVHFQGWMLAEGTICRRRLRVRRAAVQTSVFDLGVRHVQISNGEVYYHDQKTPLEADLFGLGRKSFASARYWCATRGTFRIRKEVSTMRSMQPFPIV